MESQDYLNLAGVSEADWEQTPVSVKRLLVVLIERIEDQQQRLQQQHSEIEWLKEQLNRNSGNSSMPPSSDGPKRRSRPRKGSGRQRGAQPGHDLFPRRLYSVEACISVDEYYPTHCWQCGAALRQTEGEPHRHQVVEVPLIEPEVREYRLHQCVCEGCNALTRASLPATVSRKGYGPRVAATVGVLGGLYHQSQRLTAQALWDLFGIDIALGSINNLRHEVSDALHQPVAQAHVYVQHQPVVGADETGFVQGNSDGHNAQHRKAWLWVAVTPWVSVFQLTLSRSQDAAKALLGEGFKGYLNSDRHGAYNWVDSSHRQLCWAHLKRDFIQIAERSGVSHQLGEALLEQEQQLFALWYQARDGTMTRTQFVAAVAPLRERVKALLTEGAAYPIAAQEKTSLAQTVRTCRRLLKLEDALWLFVSQEGVEPTNNASERALRPAVIWRRLSFGSQTEAGSQFVSRMLTVVTTLRSQQRDVLEFLTQAVSAARKGQLPPSLLPQQQSINVTPGKIAA